MIVTLIGQTFQDDSPSRADLAGSAGGHGGVETCLGESHAAAVKHNVITIENAMGMLKRYLKLTTVMAAKHRAKAHAVPRMHAKAAAGRPPNCHANIAANR